MGVYFADLLWCVEELLKDISSVQKRIDELNTKGHTEVKNINDIKALSEALCYYSKALEHIGNVIESKVGEISEL